MKEKSFIPNIDINVEELPSRGLAYPKGAKVSYRTYMFGEIRQVSTSTVGVENSLKIAMEGIDADFGTENLTLQDGIYLAILRKISSLNSDKFEVPYICSKCGETSKGVFNHKHIEFNDISTEVESLPLFIDLKGKEVQISPMTIKDFMTLKSGAYDGIFKDGKIDRAATQAVTVKNMNFADAYNFLYEIKDPDDIDLITDIDKMLYHNVKRLSAVCKQEIKGKVCGTENFIKLEGQEALFSPFRKSKRTTGTRIRFRSASESKPSAD